MPALYLILAHLLADFTLQPASLIAWKKKSWKGVVFHCGIFWAITLIFFLPYLGNLYAWLILTLLAISHFVLDTGKLFFNKTSDEKEFLFFFDQGMHVVFLFIAGHFFTKIPVAFSDTYFYREIYQSPRIITYFSLLIVITYAYDIYLYLKKQKFEPRKIYRPHYGDFLKRIGVFACIYVIFILYRYLR